jgi:hypothetical protein
VVVRIERTALRLPLDGLPSTPQPQLKNAHLPELWAYTLSNKPPMPIWGLDDDKTVDCQLLIVARKVAFGRALFISGGSTHFGCWAMAERLVHVAGLWASARCSFSDLQSEFKILEVGCIVA